MKLAVFRAFYCKAGVQCFLAKKHTSELAQLSTGQSVTIRGRCEGKLGNVLIKDCELVK
jgi:hypothetical protein